MIKNKTKQIGMGGGQRAVDADGIARARGQQATRAEGHWH
jgi:hypothetical protein